MQFISPNMHLFKASAYARSIVVHTLNFFKQILASRDPKYKTPDLTGHS